jgi:deoxyribose-phosphate aldolase
MPAIETFLDSTLLRPDATAAQIDFLCREAADFGFAAVCVNPVWVARCASALAQTSVRTCAVASFPFGATTSDVKVCEIERVTADGAVEVDVVLGIGLLKSGDLAGVKDDIAAVTAACRRRRAVCKIIIEAALLTDEEKVAACRIARDMGADYVKTSTGFGPGGAVAADVALMRHAVGATVGVKAAGGIRDLATARAMIGAGATRIGTSAAGKIALEARDIRKALAADGVDADL